MPGNYFKGNHFLEVQQVEQLLDQRASRRFGIAQGDYLISYHFDSPFTIFLNFHYALRRKIFRYPFHKRWGILLSRYLFHYLQNRSATTTSEKLAQYFTYREYTELPLSRVEGQRYLHALAYGINYSYAARIALASVVQDALRAVVGSSLRAELITDGGHDTFRAQTIDGEDFIVARKGAGHAEKGLPFYVSGRHDFPSLLCSRSHDHPETLNSFDHGVGYLLDHLRVPTTPLSSSSPVHLYRMSSARTPFDHRQLTSASYQKDERLKAILNLFGSIGITPAALFRPLANYKISASSLMHDVLRR